MKRVFLLSIVLSIACATHAQTQFSVPTPTLEQKYGMANMLYNNNVLGLISAAKNAGISPEELGKSGIEMWGTVWDENGGFEPFVNFILNSMACTCDGVQIVEQSSEKLVVMVSSMYRPLENQGVLFGCSIEDFLAYNNAVLNGIAVHYDKSYHMTRGEEGYRIVITL
jgi:hypothetical protein